jgi:hypothetical protein
MEADRGETVFSKGQELLRVAIVEVVVKDATQPSGLSTVRDVIIFISPALELWIELAVVSVTDCFVGAMEVFHVRLIQIGRCDVCAASKPPHSPSCLEVAIVKMHRGTVRILRMND